MDKDRDDDEIKIKVILRLSQRIPNCISLYEHVNVKNAVSRHLKI